MTSSDETFDLEELPSSQNSEGLGEGLGVLPLTDDEKYIFEPREESDTIPITYNEKYILEPQMIIEKTSIHQKYILESGYKKDIDILYNISRFIIPPDIYLSKLGNSREINVYSHVEIITKFKLWKSKEKSKPFRYICRSKYANIRPRKKGRFI